MAIVQPFVGCALFLGCAIVALLRGRALGGMRIAAAGFLLMAIGEPFLGIARMSPDHVQLGNYVQGTLLPLGGAVVLVGLWLVGPKRRRA